MAANCCTDPKDVHIVPGNGVEITGTGRAAAPYVVSVESADFTAALQVRDTDSLNLTLQGSGVGQDPFVLSGDARQRMDELLDVDDPQGPTAGDVPVYRGVGEDGHWEFAPPPASPAGAVSVGSGLQGTGESGNPLQVHTSAEAPAENPYSGGEIYADPSGALRTAAPTAAGGAVSWDQVGGKPTLFPPATHKHKASDIEDPQNLNVGKLNGITIFPQLQQPPTVGVAIGSLWVSW